MGERRGARRVVPVLVLAALLVLFGLIGLRSPAIHAGDVEPVTAAEFRGAVTK